MADDNHYVPGSFYRICDRTGFKYRADRTRKEWNNLIVYERVWEERQPQDYVRGVQDNQTVPQPRPQGQNIYIYPDTNSNFLVIAGSDGNFDYGDPIPSTGYDQTACMLVTVNDGVSEFYV